MTGYDKIVEALDVHSVKDNFVTQCPAHADDMPSLSIKRGDDDRALVYCHAGCATVDVLAALSLDFGDIGAEGHGGDVEVDQYVYTDEQGEPLVRVRRYQLDDGKKTFSQQRYEGGAWVAGLNGVRRVLYRLPELLQARSKGEPIYLVEGEKDADNLALVYDVAATTNLGGASAWRDEYAETLRGARVVIIADDDEVGRRAARAREDSLRRLPGTEVSVVLPAEGKDATDHIFAGRSLEELVDLDGVDIFEPLDWTAYEPPTTRWLLEPFLPAQSRVLAFGSAGSLKSLWAMWVAARLAGDGHRVAYFTLEMTATEAMKRMRQLGDVPKDRFDLFTKFDFWNKEQVDVAKRKLAGYSLVVVDSWTAAHNLSRRRDQNAEVAALDSEVFLPMVQATGATLLIIDNTGHDWFTQEGKRVKADHARGASAKGDKMDYSLFFSRPYEDDNYLTEIEIKKIRLDYKHPGKGYQVRTPNDRIEFYYVREDGTRGEPMWPGKHVSADPDIDTVSGIADKLTDARAKNVLGGL